MRGGAVGYHATIRPCEKRGAAVRAGSGTFPRCVFSAITRISCLTALVLQVAFAIGPISAVRGAEEGTGPLTIVKQGSFFVGGRDIKSNALSTIPSFAAYGTVTVDQVYVRYQIPLHPKKYSVTLIHGVLLNGQELGDDTRQSNGVGRIFRQAWIVRLRGGSGVARTVRGKSSCCKYGQDGKSPAGQFAGFHFSRARIGMGSLSFRARIFQGFFRSTVSARCANRVLEADGARLGYSMTPPVPTVPALSELAQRLGSTVLISHSQSGIYPFQTAAMSAKGIAAIVSIEPGTCPAPTADMAPLKNIPSWCCSAITSSSRNSGPRD